MWIRASSWIFSFIWLDSNSKDSSHTIVCERLAYCKCWSVSRRSTLPVLYFNCFGLSLLNYCLHLIWEWVRCADGHLASLFDAPTQNSNYLTSLACAGRLISTSDGFRCWSADLKDSMQMSSPPAHCDELAICVTCYSHSPLSVWSNLSCT